MIGVPLPGLANTSGNILNISNMAQPTLNPNKNPFQIFGKWTPQLLDQIKVEFSEIRETTAEFTQKRYPDNRYWKAKVYFSYGQWKQDVIKMFGCNVPYMKMTNYGSQFIVATLQKVIADKIISEGLKHDIVIALDKKFTSNDDNIWWQTINNIGGSIGAIDSNGNFSAKDIERILNATQQGFTVNLDLVFTIKLTKTKKQDRKSSDVFHLVADCSRGSIMTLKVDVEAPRSENAIPQQPASKQDITPQEVIDQLEEFTITN